ncbi:hypothetical protein ACNQ2O_02815 [Mycoplasma sp. AA7A]|uniref:hypothetical protein n=1 Tax=Mycoplasma sp. AA7A TaxID=3401665 RepID=UPI003AAAD693
MKKISKYVALMPLAAAPIISIATSENNEEVGSTNEQASVALRDIDVQRIMEWIKSNDDAFIRKFPIMQNNQTIDDFLNKWDLFSNIKSHSKIKEMVLKELNDPDKYYDIMQEINNHFAGSSNVHLRAIVTIDNLKKFFNKLKEILNNDKIRDYYAIYTFLEWVKSLSADKEIPKINNSDNTDNKYWNFYNDDKFYDIHAKTSILANFNIVFGEGDINTLFKNNFSSFSYDNVNDISSFVKDINNIYYSKLMHRSGFKLFKTIMDDAYQNSENLDVEKYLRIFDELGRSEISTKIFLIIYVFNL